MTCRPTFQRQCLNVLVLTACGVLLQLVTCTRTGLHMMYQSFCVSTHAMWSGLSMEFLQCFVEACLHKARASTCSDVSSTKVSLLQLPVCLSKLLFQHATQHIALIQHFSSGCCCPMEITVCTLCAYVCIIWQPCVPLRWQKFGDVSFATSGLAGVGQH